jgi:hypothetical protein
MPRFAKGLVLFLTLSGLLWTFPLLATEPPSGELSPLSSLAPAVIGSSVHIAEQGAGGRCIESPTTLCLDGDRFSVELRWRDFVGNTGLAGVSAPRLADSGVFWFFQPDNLEALVKVLDGCPVNGHFWVFAAAATSVEYRLTVTDHVAGITREYTKPLGSPAPALTDTFALPTCTAVGPLSLVVIANPDNVPVLGTSNLTILARDAEGFPLGSGAEIRLVSNLGSIDPERVTTDSRGEATAVFDAGTHPGIAVITAIPGGGAPASVQVIVRDAAVALTLQASPTSIPRTDFEIRLLAFVASAEGLPLQGQPVIFESQIGTFPFGNVALTNTSGRAQTTLTIRQAEISDSLVAFEVQAKTPRGDGDLLATSRTISVQ